MKTVLYLVVFVLAATVVSAYHDGYVYLEQPQQYSLRYSWTPHTFAYESYNDYGDSYSYSEGVRYYAGGCIGSGCGYNALRYSRSCAASYCQRVRYNEVYNHLGTVKYPHPRFTY